MGGVTSGLGLGDEVEVRYITEKSPLFDQLVEKFYELGNSLQFFQLWNEWRHNPPPTRKYVWHYPPVSNKKPAGGFYKGLVKKPKVGNAWYGFKVGEFEPVSDFVRPYEPQDEFLAEQRESEIYNLNNNWKVNDMPQPVNFLLTGTRGTGKSLATSAIGKVYADKFEKRRHLKPDGQRQRVLSNYWHRSADNAGPVAFKRIPVQNPATGRMDLETLEPVPPCHIDHPVTIPAERPQWSNNAIVLIDEFADYASNLRATAREARDFGAWGRQMRKQGTEIFCNTQFLNQIPGGTVGVQMDIFGRLDYDRSADEITVQCYDWYGQFYAESGQQNQKHGMDFVSKRYDWAFTICGISKLFNPKEYDTNQVIPAVWLPEDERKRILENQMTKDEVWQ